MPLLGARPISAGAYAPYGAVVEAGDPARARRANHGDALAWDALATLENLRGAHARATASLFRCLAHRAPRIPVQRLERHPNSTQLFVPMRVARYLVVVARGDGAPALDTLEAFVVSGPRAITYAPGVWHHPMIALDEDADFVNVIFVDGTERDCEETMITAAGIEVAVPPR